MSLSSTSVPFFAGEFSHGMDGKGRLTIPSAWRAKGDQRAEGEEFYFFPESGDRFLRAMRPEEFAKTADQMPAGCTSMEEKVEYQRWFCSRAHAVTVDKQGRFVLPEPLRKYLTGSEVILAGAYTAFEVWDKVPFEEERQRRAAIWQKQARLRGQ